MSISNGELANETNFNNAFLDKNTDTETVNKIALKRPASGADVTDTQQTINDNIANIATNTSNISTNTTNIGTNATNISTNASDIDDIENDYGQPNGLATLDGGGKVPVSQLPETLLEYLGTWDASTNTPALSDGTGSAGNVYLVDVAGTQDLGSGNITFAVGDWAIHNGTIWQKSLNSNAVTSVNGFTGIVVLDADNIDESTSRFWSLKHNVTTSDPAVGNDNTENYAVGSQWYNSSSSTLFIADDVSTGAAVWTAISGGSSFTPSYWRITSANGHGSTNIYYRRAQSSPLESGGTDITYVDSATLGSTWTVNSNGIYSVSYDDFRSTGGIETVGITRNDTESGTVLVAKTQQTEILCRSSLNGGTEIQNCSWTGFLQSGDVIRIHTAGNCDATTNSFQFSIARIA